MFSRYAALFVCLMLSFPLLAQVDYSANDQVSPYEGAFRPGINFGTYPTYTDEELAELAAGSEAKSIKGVGVKAARPGLFESFTELYGVDARVSTYQYYEQLGMKENTVIVGFPSDAHTDPTYYCPTTQSTLFKDMYLDIWDGGANGTPINDDNYYAKYIYELVTHYKDYVRFWEIWNEPGFDYTHALGSLPPGADGNWWDNNPDPCDYKLHAPIFHYVRMLRISYEVIKTVDPDAYVTVSGTGYPSFLDAILRNTDNPIDGSVTAEYPLQGGAYFDVMGYHAYPHFDGSLRTWNDNTQSWDYNRHSDAAVDGLGAAKDSMQIVLGSHGYNGMTYPKKNWIITESNLPRKAYQDFIGSNEAQKNWIVKSYIHCIRDSIAQMHFYKISEDTDYDGAFYEFNVMGLYKKLNNQAPVFQTPTDEGIALATTTQLLFGKTLDEAKLATLNLPEGVRGAAFKDENGNYTYVLWAETSIDQSEVASANYSFPASLNLSEISTYNWNYNRTNNFQVISPNNISLSGTPTFFVEQVFSIVPLIFCASNANTFAANNIAGATSYSWIFEGGSPTTSTQSSVNVSFAQAGTHTVSCTIKDANGAVLASQEQEIIVESLPAPSFILDMDGPILHVDTMFGWEPAQSIMWDFGDGVMSNELNPTHVYYTSGDYTVTLSATSNCGTGEMEKLIHVDVPTSTDLEYTANDSIRHLTGIFRPGANLKTFPNWTDIQLADIAAGSLSTGLKGAGVKSFRTILGENFLDYWGYDIRLDAFQHYQNLDISDNTITLGTPTFASLDSFRYCPNKQSGIFANMYLDIWDDGANGTPINDDNYFANYVYRTVMTYRDHVRYWEIFNSPDYDESGEKGWLPSGQLGNWWDKNPDPCDMALGAPIFYYNRMLRIAYEIIKKYDPDGYVTVPGLGYPSFLDAVLRNTDNPLDGSIAPGYALKGGAYFDAIGIKSYPHFDGSTSHYDGNIGGFAYDRHSDAAVGGIARVKSEFEQVFANYGYGSTYPKKEWIISEANLPRIQFGDFMGSDMAQVNWIVKAYVSAIQNDFRQMNIFSIAERSANPTNSMDAMGLYANLDNIQPYQQSILNEGSAYKTVSSLLFGMTYSASLTAQLNLDTTMAGGAFVNGNGQKIYVLWAKTKEDQQEFSQASYTFPADLFPGTFHALPWHYAYTGSEETITSPTVVLQGSPIFYVENLDWLTTPLAYFSVDSQEGCMNTPLHFTNMSSDNAASFAWSFPQGTPSMSTDENPTVSYTTPGTYSVSLTVSNDAGSHTATYVDYITVLPNPTANYTYEVTGNQVQFTNISTDATTYDWDFGDNTGIYHPTSPSYHYNQNGTYHVVLIAKNNCANDTIFFDIEIAASPKADFFTLIQNCSGPYVYHFIDISQNNPTSWAWTFENGDPTTSIEASPWVTFENLGVYAVTLIATNENGSDTLTTTVDVNGFQNEYINQTICEGDSLTIHNQVFNAANPSGEIQLWNPDGCDTILHVSVTFEVPTTTTVTDTINEGETYTVGNSVYEVAGIYTDTLTSVNGCDSIILLTLTVLDPDGTNQIQSIEGINIYPNPTNDWLDISFFSGTSQVIKIGFYDIHGRRILPATDEKVGLGAHKIRQDVSTLASGVYFVQLLSEKKVFVVRFVVE